MEMKEKCCIIEKMKIPCIFEFFWNEKVKKLNNILKEVDISTDLV